MITVSLSNHIRAFRHVGKTSPDSSHPGDVATIQANPGISQTPSLIWKGPAAAAATAIPVLSPPGANATANAATGHGNGRPSQITSRKTWVRVFREMPLFLLFCPVFHRKAHGDRIHVPAPRKENPHSSEGPHPSRIEWLFWDWKKG